MSRIPGWMKYMSHPLTYYPALSRPDLLAPAVASALATLPRADQVQVAVSPGGG